MINSSGESTQEAPCEVCLKIESVCSTCLIGNCVDQMAKSMKTIHGCNISKSMMKLVAKLAPDDDDQTINKMKNEIRDIAIEYCALEDDTKRAVIKVKIYGENLKEAAEDYLDDDILEDFTKKVMNMDDAKKKLEDVNAKQAIINGKVYRVALEAQMMFENHQADHAILQQCTEFIEEIAAEAGIAAAAGSAGTACSTTLSTTLVAVAGFLLLSYKKERKELMMETYENIARQLDLISKELEKIYESLHQIEEHLSRSQDAEKEVIAAQSPPKKSKLMTRVIDKAGDLINYRGY